MAGVNVRADPHCGSSSSVVIEIAGPEIAVLEVAVLEVAVTVDSARRMATEPLRPLVSKANNVLRIVRWSAVQARRLGLA
jgi:hypothetical protein